jgi:uncharacterized protein with HEPN domain
MKTDRVYLQPEIPWRRTAGMRDVLIPGISEAAAVKRVIAFSKIQDIAHNKVL